VTGVIKSIDLRKSRIVGEDGKLYVVPNKAVETATWEAEARGEADKTEEKERKSEEQRRENPCEGRVQPSQGWQNAARRKDSSSFRLLVCLNSTRVVSALELK
jgi:hypothetical protein